MVFSLFNKISNNLYLQRNVFVEVSSSSTIIVNPSRRQLPPNLIIKRLKAFYKSGAIRPMPRILPFGFFGLICSVIPGLFIGAAISKSVANFLEENDLFVPSDDDDDED